MEDYKTKLPLQFSMNGQTILIGQFLLEFFSCPIGKREKIM